MTFATKGGEWDRMGWDCTRFVVFVAFCLFVAFYRRAGQGMPDSHCQDIVIS